jgi:hypothetical protein
MQWDWVANTVLFGLYNVHKIWAWPSMIASFFGIAWAAKRYRSMWMGGSVHGLEPQAFPRLSEQPVGAGSLAALRLGLIWGGWLR